MLSRTFFITLADGREVVIQFQTEKLDLGAFKVAKGALGQVVLDAVALKDKELENEGVWASSLEYLPGKMWVHGVAGKGAEGCIAVNRSLGRVLSKGCLADSSGEAVSTKVRPHLEAQHCSTRDQNNQSSISGPTALQLSQTLFISAPTCDTVEPWLLVFQHEGRARLLGRQGWQVAR